MVIAAPRRRFRLLILSIVFPALLLASACGDGGGQASQPSTTKAAATGAGFELAANQTLRLNLGGEPSTLDPSKASISGELTVIEQLFRGPFKFDDKLKLVPDMAVEVPSKTNGGISADGLTYSFKLKPGLKWSDGKPITAADVAFAVRRSTDPRSAGDYADFYRELAGGDKLAKMKPDDPALDAAVRDLGVAATDEQTVRMTLAKPNAVFINYLGMWMTYPLREDVIQAKGERWTDPSNLISSGPFVLKDWVHQDHITLVPNPNYFGAQVTLQSVTLSMITDANQAYTAYQAG